MVHSQLCLIIKKGVTPCSIPFSAVETLLLKLNNSVQRSRR